MTDVEELAADKSSQAVWLFRPETWIEDIAIQGPDLISVLMRHCQDILIQCDMPNSAIERVVVRPILNTRENGKARYEIVVSGILHSQSVPNDRVIMLCFSGDDSFDAKYEKGVTMIASKAAGSGFLLHPEIEY